VSLVVIGLNHRTVPLEVLERMTIDEASLPKALADLVSRPHVTEAVVLSTCNRTEVYAFVERFHGAYEDIREFLAEQSFLPPDAFSDYLYAFYDADAARHLFRVASGLDSAVLGEHEILGQVRRAWDVSRTEASSGRVLGALFRHALEVGKRARTDTAIGRHTTSISQAAVAMAEQRLGTLAARSVLVLGAGEMGEGIATTLKGRGAQHISVANRTFATAADLAARVGGEPVRLDDLRAALCSVDVLLTSTGASALMVGSADLASVMAARDGRPLLIVDIAVPRDVDPRAAELEGVTLLDMDDLRAFTDDGRRERRREVLSVETLIEEELERFLASVSAREVAPLVAALRERAESVRLAELERFHARLETMSERDRATVEAVVAGVIGKLLHSPTVRLKDAAGTARGDRLAEALRDLFDL
jgi:glutamyl-tRNA reductase